MDKTIKSLAAALSFFDFFKKARQENKSAFVLLY
jgi:hypothetical protein